MYDRTLIDFLNHNNEFYTHFAVLTIETKV